MFNNLCDILTFKDSIRADSRASRSQHMSQIYFIDSSEGISFVYVLPTSLMSRYVAVQLYGTSRNYKAIVFVV